MSSKNGLIASLPAVARRVGCGVALAACISLAGCGNGQSTAKHPTGGPGAEVPHITIEPAQFAGIVHELLRETEPSGERLKQLGAAMRYQLSRAELRFVNGHPEAGLRALVGALYLARPGEFSADLLQGQDAALLHAARAVSKVGNSGRALAFYGMLEQISPPLGERTDAQAHMAALNDWTRAENTSAGPMRRAGEIQRSTLQRAMVEPTLKSRSEAVAAIQDWVKLAKAFTSEQTAPRTMQEREEGMEAYRALRTGALNLAALFLRSGHIDEGLAALDHPSLDRVVPPNLQEQLGRLSDGDAPESWLGFLSLLGRAGPGQPHQTGLDDAISNGAAFGAAVGLYREQIGNVEGTIPLCAVLVEYAMGEACAPMFVEALGGDPSPQELGVALDVLLRTLITEESMGDVAAARRAYLHAAPLLELASREAGSPIEPRSNQLRYTMGVIETRAGNLAAAARYLSQAVAIGPSADALKRLAAIHRQQGKLKSALADLDGVFKIHRSNGNIAGEAETELFRFELYGALGDARAQGKALERALLRSLDARNTAHTGAETARAERTLAQILEHYGELSHATRAGERAFEASSNDSRQLSMTLLDTSRRALVFGQLALGRKTVRQSIDANLDDEDLIYTALWLKLLEQRLGVSSDGTWEDALSSISAREGWPARLKAWGNGRQSHEQLLAAATTRVQKVEARFYAAMSQTPAKAKSSLLSIGKSEAIELVEVTIARNLSEKQTRFPLPPGLPLP